MYLLIFNITVYGVVSIYIQLFQLVTLHNATGCCVPNIPKLPTPHNSRLFSFTTKSIVAYLIKVYSNKEEK